jgi:two-component system, LuxR family, sensor kinase FixL
MGVGLSISKRIIESHGGELTVRRNDAGGATFTFTLPILTEAAVELR